MPEKTTVEATSYTSPGFYFILFFNCQHQSAEPSKHICLMVRRAEVALGLLS